MKNIYIGFDYKGNPIGVILSDSKEKAEIAWSAMGDIPHSIEEINPSSIEGVHGVVFLLSSEERAFPRDPKIGSRYRVWKRGGKR